LTHTVYPCCRYCWK